MQCVLPEDLVMKQFNCICEIPDNERREYLEALAGFKHVNAFGMRGFYEKLELMKLPHMAELGLTILRSRETTKIILCVSNNDLVNFLSIYYCQYGFSSICVSSGINQLGRQTAQQQFNSYNLTYRIIILAYSVASTGISLHDTCPSPKTFPRAMISFIPVDPVTRTQLLGRHIRTGITSKLVTTILLSSDVICEGETERDIFYQKSKMDIDVINNSVVSTTEPSKFPIMVKKVTGDTYQAMKNIVNELDVYVVDE